MSTIPLEQRVCIVSKRSGSDAIGVLSYGSHGLIRTYAPDALDGRVGEHTTVSTFAELRLHLNAGRKCAVPVRLARRVFGWATEDFASE